MWCRIVLLGSCCVSVGRGVERKGVWVGVFWREEKIRERDWNVR